MAGVGVGLLLGGLALLAGASFFAFDPSGRASRLILGLAGVAAVFGNPGWLKKQRLLRWWFAFVLAVTGCAFVVGGIAKLFSHRPA